MKILLIEDEPEIARMIAEGLTEANYTVEVASDGNSGLEWAYSHNYQLILLDVMLPKRDGLSICAELRAQCDTIPILVLSALDAPKDRILGLDAGADDYLPKPFDFEELLARIRALLRRDKIHRTRVIRVGDLEIDTASHRVFRAGHEITLSHREYDLLEALASRSGRVITREFIQERIWMNEYATYNTVNVHVGTLRRKLETESPVKLIHTVQGVGYTLHLPEEE